MGLRHRRRSRRVVASPTDFGPNKDINDSATTSAEVVAPIAAEKPREEYSFYDFHPKLDLDRPLKIVYPSTTISTATTTTDSVNDNSTRNSIEYVADNAIDHITSTTSSRVGAINDAEYLDKYEIKNLPSAEFEIAEPENFRSSRLEDALFRVGFRRNEPFVPPETYIRSFPFDDIQHHSRQLVTFPPGPADSFLSSHRHDLGSLDGLGHDLAVGTGLGSGQMLRVEYDMDEQDSRWLNEFNLRARRFGGDKISLEMFEVAVTFIENELLSLRKRAVETQPLDSQTLDESTCAVCERPEGTNDNAIIFCDGCNLAVHQECYGVPYIPEGEWLCRKCFISPSSKISCIFCTQTDGAFKQTYESEWAHQLCAMFIAEVSFGNPVYLEPIENVQKIPQSRWKLVCYICKQMGACIQCSNKNCFVAFHVTCARKAGLFLDIAWHSPLYDAKEYVALCHKHSPSGWRSQRNLINNIYEVQRQLTSVRKMSSSSQSTSTTSAGASRETLRKGPMVPQVVARKLIQLLQEFGLKNIEVFAYDVSKYYTLKREMRKGAPLLRRLRNNGDTAADVIEDDYLKMKRWKLARRLRRDILRCREICKLVYQREQIKLQMLEPLSKMVNTIFNTDQSIFLQFLRDFRRADRSRIFEKLPPQETPHYYEIIAHPVALEVIESRIAQRQYLSLDDLEADVEQMLTNARQYNTSKAAVYKAAVRLQHVAKELFASYRAHARRDCVFGVCLPLIEHYDIQGLDISLPSWPGDLVRAMSPLSDVDSSIENFDIESEPVLIKPNVKRLAEESPMNITKRLCGSASHTSSRNRDTIANSRTNGRLSSGSDSRFSSRSSKHTTSKPDNDRLNSRRTNNSKTNTNSTNTNRKNVNSTNANWKSINKPSMIRPNTNRPDSNRSTGNKPSGNRSSSNRSSSNRSSSNRSSSNRSSSNRSSSSKSSSNGSGGNRSSSKPPSKSDCNSSASSRSDSSTRSSNRSNNRRNTSGSSKRRTNGSISKISNKATSRSKSDSSRSNRSNRNRTDNGARPVRRRR